MDATSTTTTRWLFFSRSRVIDQREEIAFVCGSRRIEAIFSVERERTYNVVAQGELLGTKYIFEADSRRRLPGDDRDSMVPLFVGTFDHAEAISGDLIVRPRPDGELMALGVYGAPPQFQLVKTPSNSNFSPVEAHGLPGWEVRFEDSIVCLPFITIRDIRASGNPLYYVSYCLTSRNTKDDPPFMREIRAAGNPLFYAGYCLTNGKPKDDLPPMPGVLVTMLLVYQLLLKPFFHDSA